MKKFLCLLSLFVFSLTISSELLAFSYEGSDFPTVRLAATRTRKRTTTKKKTTKKQTKTTQTNTSNSYQWEFGELSTTLNNMAQNIANYNKYVFETKLTKQERDLGGEDGMYGPGLSDELYNRVWAKDKTIVAGYELVDRKGKNYAHYIHTSDPEIIFAGGIRVGASTSVLEKYFRKPLNKIGWSERKILGEICFLSESDFGECLRILHRNGRITEIEWCFWDGSSPKVKRTYDFVARKHREMGLSMWKELWEKY